MNRERLFGIVAAFLLMFGMAACSDNNDPTMKPTSRDRYIELEARDQTTSDNGTAQAIRCLDLDAGTQTIPVEVKSNTLWKVSVSGNGGWCSVDVNSGQGDGSFTITVFNNRDVDRSCVVSVYQVDMDGDPYVDKNGNEQNRANIEISQIASSIYMVPSSVDIFPAENARSQEFEIEADVAWTLSVRPETDMTGDFITIHPIEGMTEVAGSGSERSFTGNKGARFSISLSNNGSPVVRKAYIELKSENGNTSVEISQQKSEFTFDVSPNTTREMAPEGGDLAFSVYSPNEDWEILIPETNESWIKCPVTKYAKNENNRVNVVMTVEKNLTGKERSETIYFKSANSAYESVPVLVVQKGFDLTFKVSRADLPGVVMENGGEYWINVTSMFNWELQETPSWLRVEPKSGLQSSAPAALKVTVDANTTERQREAVIKVIPKLTKFSEGIELDPKLVGVDSDSIHVLQYGGQKPAISTPWVEYKEDQKEVTVSFNYYCPFTPVSAAGLEWRKVGESVWNDTHVSVSNPTNATVTITLTDLDPVTSYEARGYVVVDGKKYEGSLTGEFTTAGKYPDFDDNPFPSRVKAH